MSRSLNLSLGSNSLHSASVRFRAFSRNVTLNHFLIKMLKSTFIIYFLKRWDFFSWFEKIDLASWSLSFEINNYWTNLDFFNFSILMVQKEFDICDQRVFIGLFMSCSFICKVANFTFCLFKLFNVHSVFIFYHFWQWFFVNNVDC